MNARFTALCCFNRTTTQKPLGGRSCHELPDGRRAFCRQRCDEFVCIVELSAFATSLSLFKLGFELLDLNLPSRPIVVGRTNLKQKWVE